MQYFFLVSSQTMSTPKQSKKSTSIKASPETVEKLEKKKSELKVRSLDAVLNYLVDNPPGQDQEAHAEAPVQDDDPGVKKKRKNNVRDPLYSSELIDKREGMLKHLTGFERPEVEKLTKRFKEVGIV